MTGDWFGGARALAARGALLLTCAGMDALAVAVASMPVALAFFVTGAGAVFMTNARRVITRGAIFLIVVGVGIALWALAATPNALAIFSTGGMIDSGAELTRERALVVFDGQTQTLVVEPSARVAPGRSFVWAVALPAAPEYVKSISPGALNTLEFAMRPRLIPHGARGVIFPILAVVVGWTMAAGALWIRRDIRRAALIPAGVAAGFGALALLALNLDPGEKARAFPAVTQRGPVASDYEILQINSAPELKDWLRQNGFGEPTGAPMEALNDYGQRGWVFVLARLKGRAPAPEFTLQPIEMRFPTDAAIMPVRLNAVAAPNGLRTLLFTHTPKAVAAPGFTVEFSDKLIKQPVEIVESNGPGGPASATPTLTFRPIQSENYGALIKEQADLNRILPAAGWLTRMSHVLTPAEMTQDITFQQTPTPVKRVKAFTTRAALARAVAVFLLVFSIALPLAGLMGRRGRLEPGLGFGFGSAIAVAFAVAHFASAPKTSWARVLTDPREDVRRGRQRLETDLSRFAAMDPPRGKTVSDVVAETLEKNHVNPYTGAPMRREQSPGNFSVETTLMGGAIVSLYDDTLGVTRLMAPLRVGRYTARAVIHMTPSPEPTAAAEEKKSSEEEKPKKKSGSGRKKGKRK